MVNEKQLAEFKALYKKHFNEELPEDIALEKAIQLVRLMEIIYKPMTEKQMEKVMRRRRELGFEK